MDGLHLIIQLKKNVKKKTKQKQNEKNKRVVEIDKDSRVKAGKSTKSYLLLKRKKKTHHRADYQAKRYTNVNLRKAPRVQSHVTHPRDAPMEPTVTFLRLSI